MSPVLCPLTHLAVVELDTKVFCARREGAARGPWRERWEERRRWIDRRGVRVCFFIANQSFQIDCQQIDNRIGSEPIRLGERRWREGKQ